MNQRAIRAGASSSAGRLRQPGCLGHGVQRLAPLLAALTVAFVVLPSWAAEASAPEAPASVPAPMTPSPPPASGEASAADSPPTSVPNASRLNPQPAEFPQASGAATESAGAVAARLDQLLSRVAELRGRIAALTTTLFSSRLEVAVRTEGSGVALASLRVTLDGGTIYTAPDQTFFEDPVTVYEHAMAPGPHVLGVEIERHERSDRRFSTWQSSRFVIVVPEKQRLRTRLELTDESDMAEPFSDDRSGRYELGVRLRVEVAE